MGGVGVGGGAANGKKVTQNQRPGGPDKLHFIMFFHSLVFQWNGAVFRPRAATHKPGPWLDQLPWETQV